MRAASGPAKEDDNALRTSIASGSGPDTVRKRHEKKFSLGRRHGDFDDRYPPSTETGPAEFIASFSRILYTSGRPCIISTPKASNPSTLSTLRELASFESWFALRFFSISLEDCALSSFPYGWSGTCPSPEVTWILMTMATPSGIEEAILARYVDIQPI